MHKIAENGIITLTAGDSLIAPLYLFTDENSVNKYTLTGTDKLCFAIMAPHQPFECALVRKIFTANNNNENGDILVILSPEDTENLKPGLYYYEAKLIVARNGVEYVDTVISKRKFYIL